jgi:hypothetical protein
VFFWVFKTRRKFETNNSSKLTIHIHSGTFQSTTHTWCNPNHVAIHCGTQVAWHYMQHAKWLKCYALWHISRLALHATCQVTQCAHLYQQSDFTLWRHTWWKNWVNCAVLTGNSAGFRTVFSSRLSHRELRSSRRESHSYHSLRVTLRWHHLKAHPFLAIHSADERRMLYSFSNTTSYSTFYALYSSFLITLWPLWLANSKGQPCFYPP